MSNIVLRLEIASNVIGSPYVSGGDVRVLQYVNGLNAFFEYEDILLDEGVSVFLSDNTVKSNESLDERILECVPDWVELITFDSNVYGSVNKGAGSIEQLRYCESYIRAYDWFVHYEPRMLLQNFDFFASFFDNPRALFTMGGDANAPLHFYTGAYTINVVDLCNYIHCVDLDEWLSGNIGIEYSLYNYITSHKIEHDILERVNAIWLDTFANVEVLV